jgi:hypothetical protein
MLSSIIPSTRTSVSSCVRFGRRSLCTLSQHRRRCGRGQHASPSLPVSKSQALLADTHTATYGRISQQSYHTHVMSTIDSKQPLISGTRGVCSLTHTMSTTSPSAPAPAPAPASGPSIVSVSTATRAHARALTAGTHISGPSSISASVIWKRTAHVHKGLGIQEPEPPEINSGPFVECKSRIM